LNYDYAIHSSFLIHWTGKDIDKEHDELWHEADKSKTKQDVTDLYLTRLYNILKYGLWMTEENSKTFLFDGTSIPIPKAPTTCFTELKLSESRKHARRYGRLGIGVKRPFIFDRGGRPVIYYHPHRLTSDVFLKHCVKDLANRSLLNFFKPMHSSKILNFDLYAESEWRIICSDELSKNSTKQLIDPRDSANAEEYQHFNQLPTEKREKLKYLLPLDGWLSTIIYPSLEVKNKAQQDTTSGIKEQIQRIKDIDDHGNRVERSNWPIEVNLDACRNF